MLLPCLKLANFPALAALITGGGGLSESDLQAAISFGVASDVVILGTSSSTSSFTSSSSSNVTPPPPPTAKLDLELTKPLIRRCRVRVGPFAASDVDEAVSWLDAGAIAVIFEINLDAVTTSSSSTTSSSAATTTSTTGEGAVIAEVAEAISSLPASRVMVRFVGTSAQLTSSSSSPAASLSRVCAALTALKPLISGVILPLGANTTGSSIPADILRQLRSTVGHHVTILLENSEISMFSSPADVGRLHRHEIHFLSGAVRGVKTAEEVELAAGEGKLDIGSCYAACARSDRPDGLFTTVVSDECGKTLGLVYSSTESILEAIRCKRGVYYSRSRGGLWRKGDTSGAFQELVHVKLDCDADALLFTVKQHGNPAAFCHLNTRTCWGEDVGLTALERTLAARKIDAPVGSYTKRLFNDPVLLRNKLLEEAQELAEATEPDHVASETADLLYFALAACARAGVKLSDVEAHLDRRTLKVRRRPGDSKPYRIAAAAAFLDSIAASKTTGTTTETTTTTTTPTTTTSTDVLPATASAASGEAVNAVVISSSTPVVGAGAGSAEVTSTSAVEVSSSGAGAMPA